MEILFDVHLACYFALFFENQPENSRSGGGFCAERSVDASCCCGDFELRLCSHLP